MNPKDPEPGQRADAAEVMAGRLSLEVAPRLADQEWSEPVRYWEGAVAVTGSRGDQPIAGAGYVELVGYATPAAGREGITSGRPEPVSARPSRRPSPRA